MPTIFKNKKRKGDDVLSTDLLNGKIRVYNYEKSPATFPSKNSEYGILIEGRDEDSEFVMERVLWDDIESENSKSDIFKIGRLRFHPKEEDEVYKKLGIEDRENIMNDFELIEFLSDDSIENLKKINKIKSSMLLTRMKTKLFEMERSNRIPPHNVITVVLEKCDELKSGKTNPDSFINRLLANEADEKNKMKMENTVNTLKKEIEQIKKEANKKEEDSLKIQKSFEELMAMFEEVKKENETLKKNTEKDTSSKKTTKTDKSKK